MSMSHANLDAALEEAHRTIEVRGTEYDEYTGDVSIPCGSDAGETKYIVVRFSSHDRKWRVLSSSIRPAGKWKPAVGVTEADLIAISDRAYAAAE